MKIQEKYLTALKETTNWLTVAEWAQLVANIYPDLLAKAEVEAVNQKQETTGLREIAARISSAVSAGNFTNTIEVDTSERPKKVRFLDDEAQRTHEQDDIEQDVAPLKRSEIIKRDSDALKKQELYRIDEFEAISRQLKSYFFLDFEVDHAKALLNKVEPGNHHPDNLQLLLKQHNGKKNSNNWQRFSLEEQKTYIRVAINLQSLVAMRFDDNIDLTVLESLLKRIEAVY